MRELTRSSDARLIASFQKELGALDVPSTVTTEIDTFPVHSIYYILWIDDDPLLVEKAKGFLKENGVNDVPPSRISVSEEMVECLSCKYDLRGQTRDGNCPECGHPYYVVHEVRCPACQADLPSDFEICWNCNHHLPPPLPPK